MIVSIIVRYARTHAPSQRDIVVSVIAEAMIIFDTRTKHVAKSVRTATRVVNSLAIMRCIGAKITKTLAMNTHFKVSDNGTTGGNNE